MGDKAKTLLAMRRFKLVDRILRSVYCCHCVLPFIRNPVCIVGLVPNTLQNDECFREFLDFTRESLHCLNLLASIFCVSVFKCAVNLMPSRAAFSADEQVGGSVGERVEHSIIRGADRAAQVGLCGLSRIKLRQAAGSRYQVARVQVSSHLYIGWQNHIHWKPILRILSFRMRRKADKFSPRPRIVCECTK